MNATATATQRALAPEEEPLSSLAPVPVRSTFEGHYGALIQVLLRLNQAEKPAVVAFTAASGGEGVSYVVHSAALELSRFTRDHILIATTHALEHGGTPVLLGGADPANVWTLRPGRGRTDEGTRGLEKLYHRFGYILLDCPPVSRVPIASSWIDEISGACLVVAAGKSSREQIVAAHRSLVASGITSLGCVLNKRTYPIPSFIYKRL